MVLNISVTFNEMSTVTCTGCEANIDDDLFENQWCQSCIDSYSDITHEDTGKIYIMGDQDIVWSLV
jgi:hypothetical protein